MFCYSCSVISVSWLFRAFIYCPVHLNASRHSNASFRGLSYFSSPRTARRMRRKRLRAVAKRVHSSLSSSPSANILAAGVHRNAVRTSNIRFHRSITRPLKFERTDRGERARKCVNISRTLAGCWSIRAPRNPAKNSARVTYTRYTRARRNSIRRVRLADAEQRLCMTAMCAALLNSDLVLLSNMLRALPTIAPGEMIGIVAINIVNPFPGYTRYKVGNGT